MLRLSHLTLSPLLLSQSQIAHPGGCPIAKLFRIRVKVVASQLTPSRPHACSVDQNDRRTQARLPFYQLSQLGYHIFTPSGRPTLTFNRLCSLPLIRPLSFPPMVLLATISALWTELRGSRQGIYASDTRLCDALMLTQHADTSSPYAVVSPCMASSATFSDGSFCYSTATSYSALGVSSAASPETWMS